MILYPIFILGSAFLALLITYANVMERRKKDYIPSKIMEIINTIDNNSEKIKISKDRDYYRIHVATGSEPFLIIEAYWDYSWKSLPVIIIKYIENHEWVSVTVHVSKGDIKKIRRILDGIVYNEIDRIEKERMSHIQHLVNKEIIPKNKREEKILGVSEIDVSVDIIKNEKYSKPKTIKK